MAFVAYLSFFFLRSVKVFSLPFVYIVGWDFSPTFLVVWFDNKCWTENFNMAFSYTVTQK